MGERLYRISVVAEMLGLSENLLRAWERRYGIVEPRRSDSGYRGYTDDDIALLRRVKQLTNEGVSIGDVIPLLGSLRKEVKADRVHPVTETHSVDAVERWKAAILDAARKSDQARLTSVLDEAMATLSPVVALDQVIIPVQRTVGDLWHAGELSVAQEHLVTHAMRARLFSLIHGAAPGSRGHVVCVCLPDEDHEVGLLGVALRFRQAGFRVTYLGARTPIAELGELAHRIKPDRIAISQVTQLDKKAFRKLLVAVRDAVPSSTQILVGGRGAEPHQELIASLGLLTGGPSDWPRLLA